MTMTFEELQSTNSVPTIRTNEPDDLFITAGSYEERSVLFAEVLAKSTYRAKQGLIYVHREFTEGLKGESTRSHVARLSKALWRCCGSVETVKGSWLSPRDQVLSLRSTLTRTCPPRVTDLAVTVDATTFTRETLMILTTLLRSHVSRAAIRIVYVSPKDHGPWLSRGFRAVRTVLGFSGIQQASRPTLLVILSGFEPERALRLIEEHEPKKVLLGIGNPPTADRFRERNKAEQKLILSRQDVEMFDFPADDVETCRIVLEKLLSPRVRDSNVILAPMNTKLSTLAALLVAEAHPEIQLTYCLPGEYNVEDYSTGVDKVFMTSLPYLEAEEQESRCA